MKARLAAPGNLIDLRHVPELKGIQVSGDSVTIGGATTHFEVAKSADVKKAIPTLAALAGSIGDAAGAPSRHDRRLGRQQRSGRRLSGRRCWRSPARSTPTSGRSRPTSISPASTRRRCEEGEIVTKVAFKVPAQRPATQSSAIPASRYPMAGVFIAKHKDGSVRVAVTGAGNDGVFRWKAAEEALAEEFLRRRAEGAHGRQGRHDGRHPRLGRIPRQPRRRHGPPRDGELGADDQPDRLRPGASLLPLAGEAVRRSGDAVRAARLSVRPAPGPSPRKLGATAPALERALAHLHRSVGLPTSHPVSRARSGASSCVLLAALVARSRSSPRPARAVPDPANWPAVLAEARGQTVYFHAWGGEPRINDYIAWAGADGAGALRRPRRPREAERHRRSGVARADREGRRPHRGRRRRPRLDQRREFRRHEARGAAAAERLGDGAAELPLRRRREQADASRAISPCRSTGWKRPGAWRSSSSSTTPRGCRSRRARPRRSARGSPRIPAASPIRSRPISPARRS